MLGCVDRNTAYAVPATELTQNHAEAREVVSPRRRQVTPCAVQSRRYVLNGRGVPQDDAEAAEVVSPRG